MGIKEKRTWVATCDQCGKVVEAPSATDLPQGWVRVSWRLSHTRQEHVVVFDSMRCVRDYASRVGGDSAHE